MSGTSGSGTIFFAGCTMRCVYCQNHAISRGPAGREMDTEELADLMLELQTKGAHNINLVTPGHFAPQIARASARARLKGLSVPLVWNSNAYEKEETLRMMEGLVDVYLPDFRYWTEESARAYSSAPGYPGIARQAITAMKNQVGHLTIVEGLAQRGLLVRILVLPGLAREAESILEWIASSIGTESHISLMGQYYPAYEAGRFPELNRSLTREEYDLCLDALDRLGLENGFIQEVGSSAHYTPDFEAMP